MGVLITTSDFTGRYALPQSAFSQLDKYIDTYEEEILADLLGVDMYNDFKDDLTDKVPQQDKYVKIYNQFREDYSSKIYSSKGMKVMLLGFIWFQYMRDVKFKATVSGSVSNKPDASQQERTSNLYQYYNEAVETYQAIQTYIEYIKPADYIGDDLPTYNGQYKEFSSPFFQ